MTDENMKLVKEIYNKDADNDRLDWAKLALEYYIDVDCCCSACLLWAVKKARGEYGL